MNQKKDIAIANFRSGLNCAQSVLAAYSDIYHIDKQAALSLSCGFGGGMGQEFSKRFTLLNGTLNCKTLLNCDLRTEEGQQYMKDNNLIEVVCEKCIADSIMILDELIVA
jgi:hypothetical protein